MDTITLTRTQKDVRDVRPLLSRTGQYIVPTETLVASLASQIVDEQHGKFYIRETVAWAMATFNVMPATGQRAAKSVSGIAVDIEAHITKAVGNDTIPMNAAVQAVHAALAPVYGHRVRITGWMPGHRVAGHRTVLEILDDPCPECHVNPIGYKVGDAKTARCLNTEDCGWTSA